ncbi:2OG-Fe(II)oxygenase [Acanthamoeba polyphaga moumouvirus]|uniref:2OG-Fe(II)oxygenase n=1 Tax=Acanthamoeba polyphaga moumouvirus TaxID=1269028 RepID=L7RGN7_9VIRU|nr:2OG-Fe(II)oxygenase [Acanthamoeba polyphaga moumouvirus]AGC02280.1 2OG-Fe(II)oxygenase [Acanthamoeba polyphaga moumouvirus]AQN68623.1 2OG-fe(II) oxygenase [Saudi moumouvirus]
MEKIIEEFIKNKDNNDNLDKINSKFKFYIKEIIKPIVPKPIVYENISGIQGLWYVENYLSIDLHNNILDLLKEINFEPIGKNYNSRRVAHFGYYYSYNKSGLKTAPAIPEYLQNLVPSDKINNTIKKDLLDKEFNQLIINEYKSNQQISYHTDHKTQFGPIIACITIGESVPIMFKNNHTIKTLDVKKGSLYIMTGESRYIWQHSLKNNSENTRYSLTFRTALN